ncbi:MAG: HDOD domain-containing protein, partial [Planctomycetes bacterium]|nr:HDOD domain-containing protein [Planctomycetota bacterium]
MKNAVYKEIKSAGKLPSPSGVALELMRLVEDEASKPAQIVATVESDPALAARVIKLVNSPLYGASRTIGSVSMAVKLLGRHSVKNLALGMSLLAAHRDGASKAFNFERFWSESVARAVAARGLAKQLGGCAPDEAFTVALLCKIGHLALATAFPKAYDDLLGKMQDRPLPALLQAERETFQIDHNDLTAAMMADWRLADVFCEFVRIQDAIDDIGLKDDSRAAKIARTQRLAGAMATVLVKPKVFREDLAGLLRTADTFGLDANHFTETFDAVKEAWRNLGSVLSVQTHEAPSLQEAHTRASRTQQRILVVDDDPTALHLLSKYLIEAGYEVLTATNGVEALRIVHAERCSLVITDWMMPEMDGL